MREFSLLCSLVLPVSSLAHSHVPYRTPLRYSFHLTISYNYMREARTARCPGAPGRCSWVGYFRQRPSGGCSSPAVNVYQRISITKLLRRSVANRSTRTYNAEQQGRWRLRCTSFRSPLTVPAVARSCRYIVSWLVRLSVPKSRDGASGKASLDCRQSAVDRPIGGGKEVSSGGRNDAVFDQAHKMRRRS